MNSRVGSLLGIMLIALVFRGFEFGKIPAGIYVDEASHGYNAYSLLLTGKDEYGKSWPILNRSFGTYASNLYTYFTILPTKLFGMSEVSIRLPSLIFGLILVLLSYIFGGFTVGFIIAISPVFVFYSRAAFEANLGLTLLFLGLILATRKRLPLSFLILSLSAYAYHMERILSLVFIVFISAHYFSAQKKIVIFSLFLALIVQTPLLATSLTSGANSRITALSGGNYPLLLLSYFSPNNIFSRPDPEPNRSFADLGIFYWWMAFPFIAGLISFIKNKEDLKFKAKLLLVLFLVPPIVAAFTRDYFSSLRVLPMFLPIAWIISKGLGQKRVIYILILLISSLEIYSNLVLLKHEGSVSWQYPYKSLSAFIRNHPYETIVIDNARSGPIYILLAFYNHIDPRNFQSLYSLNWLKKYYDHTQFSLNTNLGNVQIRSIYWEDDVKKDQIIISDKLGISDSQAREHSLVFLNTFNDTNNQPVLFAYKTNTK